jgi:tetratricopeptide (TPR) repeat protein
VRTICFFIFAIGLTGFFSRPAFCQDVANTDAGLKRGPLTIEDIQSLSANHVYPERISSIVREFGVVFAATDDNLRRMEASGVAPLVIETVKKVALDQETKKADKAQAVYNSGVEALRKGDYKKALEAFTIFLQTHPNHSSAHLYVGNCHSALGHWSEAIDSYKQVTRIQPSHAGAYYDMGVAYSKLGRHEDAINAYKNAVSNNPRDANAYYNMGIAYSKLGRHEDATKVYREVVRLEPNNASAYFNMGLSNYALGNNPEAIEAYKQVIKIKPDQAEAYYSLGLAYVKTGNKSEATKCQKALEQLDRNLADNLAKTIR